MEFVENSNAMKQLDITHLRSLSSLSTQPKPRPGQRKIMKSHLTSPPSGLVIPVSYLLYSKFSVSDSFFGKWNPNLWAAGSAGGDTINIATVYPIRACANLGAADAQHRVQSFSCHHIAFLWSRSWWSERSSKEEEEDWCDLHNACAKRKVVQELIRSWLLLLIFCSGNAEDVSSLLQDQRLVFIGDRKPLLGLS